MDKWILNIDDYENFFGTSLLSFTHKMEYWTDDTTTKNENHKSGKGDISFIPKNEMPTLSDKFTLVLKHKNEVTMYEECEINKTGWRLMASPHPRDGDSIDIHYESTTSYTHEEYRNLKIDNLIN